MKFLRLTPALKATSAPYNQFSLGLKDTIEQTIFSFHSYEDIKIDKDKFSVLEINSVPSWKALQQIEKINISEVLVNDFLKKGFLKKKVSVLFFLLKSFSKIKKYKMQRYT